MKGARPPSAHNLEGQLLGHKVTTRAAQPTSAKAIGVEVGALLQPLQQGLRGRQFVSPALLAAWPEIVGERLAGLCMPVQMKAQPKGRSVSRKGEEDGAVLEVRADAAIRIDLDYGQALIVERVNAFFGYRAVAKLRVLARAALDSPPPAAQGPAPTVPTAQSQEAARRALTGVRDPGLRTALERLGACVLAGESRNR